MRPILFLNVIALTAAMVGCGGPEKPAEAPPAPPTTSTVVPVTPETATAATSHPAEAGDLLAQLKSSKLTLAQGIQLAEKESGVATSAKFELEDGKLSLSVYAAKAGLDKDAEHNVLVELAGDPTQDNWTPKSEVFADKEHITRASMHLTLVKRARTNLAAVIEKASARQMGTVYSVTPAVKDRKPVFEVLVATTDGKSVPVTVE